MLSNKIWSMRTDCFGSKEDHPVLSDAVISVPEDTKYAIAGAKLISVKNQINGSNITKTTKEQRILIWEMLRRENTPQYNLSDVPKYLKNRAKPGYV